MSSRNNRKSRPLRKSKKFYYFIVEGFTEENYLKLLKKIYQKGEKIENCNGGSAKNVLNKARKIIRNRLIN